MCLLSINKNIYKVDKMHKVVKITLICANIKIPPYHNNSSFYLYILIYIHI